jgi:hypothetical protein
VTVNVGPAVSIALGGSSSALNTSSSSPVAGVVATSIGSPGGVCCANGSGILLNTIVNSNDTVIDSFGQNGSGGAVAVNFSGSIFGNSSNLYGIIASSVGASTQIPVTISRGLLNVPASGLGGSVSTQLAGGAINLSGTNSVGIFASSLSSQVIIPSMFLVAGSGNSSGSVQVTMDGYSSISVGSSNQLTTGQMSAGIVALSSTGWLFQPIGSLTPGAVSAGNGGNVTIANAGTISSYGGSAFGVVGLSLGNGGVLSNAPSSVSNIQYFGLPSGAAKQSNYGGTVTITNSGSIITNGNAAIGVLAASNGSGGVVAQIPNATFLNPSPNSQNISIGTVNSGFIAGANATTFSASGGSVNLTNTGSVQTNGIVAGGILAQSIGGGGGSLTEGAALFAGDAGGSGGAGGSISFTNSGSVSTTGDASIGFLGQSIGGGGGQAANTAGLFVALGGRGGSGGAGGNITANFLPGSQFTTSGDFSSGLVLHSIGGGGGNGGYGRANGIFISTGIGGTGGAGGTGGNITIESSSTLSLNTTTYGDQSHALFLQTIGGGGGIGGHAYSSAPGLVFAGAVAIGGSGGTAGGGGTINVSGLNGTISTAGTDSVGIMMQSIGGGGGYGGGAISQAYAYGGVPDVPTISLSTSIGGSAAAGANGGAINAYLGNAVSTFGTGSHAIFAQSIGGGGGGGADSTAGANTLNNSDFTFISSTSLGGKAGGGGNGGAITLNVQSSNNISTVGHNAAGIFGQSVGGGGGYGGVGNAYQNDASIGKTQVGLTFALGGTGGNGGAGGAITISNSGNSINSITTIGSQSPGIIGQSIAGGGGVGGNAGSQGAGGNISIGVTVGGSAGGGQAGGTVSIGNNNASITTGMQLDLASSNVNSMNLSQPIAIGGDSHGIFAQSIGGGGGIGGNADPSASLIGNVQSLISTGATDYLIAAGVIQYFQTGKSATAINYNSNIAVGGRGGAGGDGGAISIVNTGNITTFGHRSYGIFAQSIGGGGGTAGSSTASSTFITGAANYSPLSGVALGLGINVGGMGGNGGNGGSIYISTDGPSPSAEGSLIGTAGYGSHGIVAQSIGGGGGAAHDGAIFNASGSAGIGKAAVKQSISLGSFSGNAGMVGQGGNITLGGNYIDSGAILTLGDAASGAILQSIGGGGGLATFGCTNTGNGVQPTYTQGYYTKLGPSACFQNASSTTAPGASDGSLTPAAFQGAAGAQQFYAAIQSSSGTSTNSQGGAINVTNGLVITTQGSRAIGLIAQSIGGGGGYIAAPAQALTSAVLPTGGNNQSPGGSIGISFQNGGSITTLGNGAWGILAQSIGGGGGFIGDPTFNLNSVPISNISLSSTASPAANGGAISIQTSNSNPITTYGINAHAIVAQSIGGGGGIANAGTPTVGSTGGSAGVGGAINISTYGDITTYGPNSVGIFAQSSGTTSSSGVISININGGLTVYNYGVSPSTLSGPVAIVVSGGSTDSTNANIVTVGALGTIIAGSGTAIISNYGYTNFTNNGFVQGNVILGTTNSPQGNFTNNGSYWSGLQMVVSNNSFHNYGLFSIGALDSASKTNLTGRLYQHQSGQLAISIDSLTSAKNDYLQVNGTAIVEGSIRPLARSLLPGPVRFLSATDLVSSAAVTDTHVYDWNLVTSGNELIMTPTQRFSPAGFALTPNQQSLAAYLGRAWNNSDASLAKIFGYLHEVPFGNHANYQGILNQLSGQALNSQAIQMKTAFVSALSYGMACPLLNTRAGDMKETDCTWGFVSGNLTDQSSNASNFGYSATTGTVRFGAQNSFGADLAVGFALGYSTNKLTSTGFSSNGNMLDLSVSASKSIDQWSFGTSLAYAQGWFNNSRTPQLFGIGIADKLSSSYASNSGMYGLGWRVRSAYSFQRQNYYIKPYVDLDLIYAKQPSYAETSGILALRSSGSDQLNFAATPMVELGGNLPFSDTVTV